MNKIIKVKCWPEYFEAVAALKKPFEIRKDDRDYQVKDTLILEEWNPTNKEYTNRVLLTEITYKLESGQFGIELGYCVLGIKPKYQTSAIVMGRKELNNLISN